MTVKFSQNARRFYIGTMSRRALCRCILGNTPLTAACFRDVNDVNRVNDVNDVKAPTPAACGGVSGGTPPAASGFSDVIDAVDIIDSGRG
jgi:hypothetical protein